MNPIETWKMATSWSMTVKEADKPHTAIFYCSTTVAANRLYPKEQYPSIIQDYRATFKKLKTLSADVFLSNHQGFFQLWEKRARQQAGGANPFIDPAELQTFVAKSAEEFEADLAKQRASADGLSTPDKRPH